MAHNKKIRDALVPAMLILALAVPSPSFAQTKETGKAGANSSSPAPDEKNQDSSAGSSPAPFGPEQYFELLLKRQKLSISSDQQVLTILDAHAGDPASAMKDLKSHEKEKQARIEAMSKKYGTTPKEYLRSVRGGKELEERSKYLDDHPEIRDELAASSKQLNVLEKEVWARMKPLWTKQNPSLPKR